MSVPAVNSALDVANWFFKQAEREEIYLENEKVQHLLFLAQVHYALLNNKDYLSPSLFICDDNGFTEPNLAKTLSFGRPLMNRPDFPTQLNSFLTLIWKKYSPLSIRDLSSFIKNSPTYLDNYRMGQKNIVDVTSDSAQFKNHLTPAKFSQAEDGPLKKVLISQNGPVVVSKWQPRKLNSQNPKENFNV